MDLVQPRSARAGSTGTAWIPAASLHLISRRIVLAEDFRCCGARAAPSRNGRGKLLLARPTSGWFSELRLMKQSTGQSRVATTSAMKRPRLLSLTLHADLQCHLTGCRYRIV